MKLLRKLALALASLALALLAGEGMVRLYLAVGRTPADSSYIKDRYAIYRLRPSAGGEDDPENYINSLGFHDREHAMPKPPGTVRILGIGDSFVYSAVPLPDNFLRVTEDLLIPPLGRLSLKPDMVLMGLGGYSPENEVGILRSEGLALNPDLVVLNFYVGNDVNGIGIRGEVFLGTLYYTGSANPVLHILRKSRLFTVSEYAFMTRIKRVIIARQNREWARRMNGGQETAPPGASPAAGAGQAPGVSPPASVTTGYVEIEKRNLPVQLRRPDRRTLGWWRKAEDYLVEFNRRCHEAGVPWILNIIPDETQVDPLVREQVMKALDLRPQDYDPDAPQRRLRDFAQSRAIPCLDPLEAMRAAHRPEARLYIPNDTHLNVRGNRLMGELLAGFIVEHHLVPLPASPAVALAQP